MHLASTNDTRLFPGRHVTRQCWLIHHAGIRGRASLCAKPSSCNRHAQHHFVTLISLIVSTQALWAPGKWTWTAFAIPVIPRGHHVLWLARLAIPLLRPDNHLHERLCTCKIVEEQ